ncbi:MAG: hypothetical protein ACE5OP_09895 [Candidatus Glassbacteria bacterium]
MFRSRIGEEGAGEIFEVIVKGIKDAGVLVGREKAVDDTHVEADAASHLTFLELMDHNYRL